MACGLHKIDSYELNQRSLFPLLQPPRDQVDLGDMIYTWWGVFCADRISALILEVPITIPDDDNIVTTLWPLEDYADERVIFTPCRGFSTLCSPAVESSTEPSPYHNLYAFRVKAYAMLYHAILLVSSFKGSFSYLLAARGISIVDCPPYLLPEGVDVACDAYLALRATSRLSKEMESYRQRTCPTFDTCHRDDYGRVTALVFSMTATYAASIQLLHILSDRDADSYQQRLDVARECASLGIEVSRDNPRLLHVTIGFPWASAYEVLAWQHIRLNQPTDNEGATDVRAELDAFVGAFKIYARQHGYKYTQHNWPFRVVGKFDIHKIDLATN